MSRWTIAVLSVLLGAMTTLVFVHRKNAAPVAECAPTETPTPADPRPSTVPPAASASPARPADPSPAALASTSAPAQSALAAASAASDPKQAAPAAPEGTRVRLEVIPHDSKVIFRDGSLWEGPIGEIEVPRGKRVVLQITRKGYAARRLVLDGTKRKMTIGLVKKPSG